MTDEIPQTALDAADKMPGSYRDNLARMLAKHPEYVAKPKKPDVPLLAMKAAFYVFHTARLTLGPSYPAILKAHAEVLAKHGYAVVKVATDEERLIEARDGVT